MGKVTYEGLRKPDDPVLRQSSIVLGGLSTRSGGQRETEEARRNRVHREYWRKISWGLDDDAEKFAIRWFADFV